MQALQGNMTYAQLILLDTELEHHWLALCGKIRFLDRRLGMILGVKEVEEEIADHKEGRFPEDEILREVRLAMVTLEFQLGAANVQRLLETQPLAFVSAISGVHNCRNDWLQNEQVDETEYLTQFFMHMAMAHQRMYESTKDGQFTMNFDACADKPKALAELCELPEAAIAEIDERAKALVASWVENMEVDVILEDEALSLVEETAT